MADQDKDGKLNKTEFSAFLFPDQHKHMLDHLVVEYLGKYDTNQDGHITFDEYMSECGLWVASLLFYLTM